jgi:type I restriction enzyme M protein
MPARAPGRAALLRARAEVQRKLASLSLKGQLDYLVWQQEPGMMGRYRAIWIDAKAAEELDSPIFFAVSEKGGKDNSGEPVYKKDANGDLLLDPHGHLVVDHDLDEIADAFIAFAQQESFDFWVEG